LETRTTEQKKVILNKLINSGINVSPTMLKNILNTNNPLKNLNLLIKEISFIPSFKSHLTETVIKDISDEKLQRVLKRTISKTKSLVTSSLMDKNIPSEFSPLIEKSKTDYKSQETVITNLLPKKIAKMKNTQKTPGFESTKSIFTYKPIAKEYKANYEVIQDPTNHLFTNGKYDDFYELTIDKYNKLKNLIRKRPEVSSATNINNIFRISNSIEISTLGLVDKIHQTKKGNFLFTLEDLTGKISVLIQNNSENLD